MCELPIKMASLQIVEENETSDPNCHYVCPGQTNSVDKKSPVRMLRKRIANASASVKRRCKLPPRKYCKGNVGSGPSSLEEISTLYTSKGNVGNKPIKCLLETIYEEPVKRKNGSILLMGIKKKRRTVTFADIGCITKAKQRKRKSKAKLIINKWLPKRTGETRVLLDNLLAQLEESRQN